MVIVDTEFMRRNTFYPEVALVQLCFVTGDSVSDMAWLIDPLEIDSPEPLAASTDESRRAQGSSFCE